MKETLNDIFNAACLILAAAWIVDLVVGTSMFEALFWITGILLAGFGLAFIGWLVCGFTWAAARWIYSRVITDIARQVRKKVE